MVFDGSDILPSRSAGLAPSGALLTALVLAILLPGSMAKGQAWTQPLGKAYVKVSQQRATASEQFTANGARAPYANNVEGDAFVDNSAYLYAEVGVRKNMTAILLVPYKRFTVKSADGPGGRPGANPPIESSASGVEKIQLGLRWDASELFGLEESSPNRMALNVSVRIPAFYTLDATPSLGPGQVDIEAMLFFGRSFWPAPVYAQAGAGYRIRSGIYGFSSGGSNEPSYGDEWLLHGEAGVSLGRWALIQGLMFGVVSNQAPTAALDPQNPVPTHQRYIKLGGGLVLYPVDRLGLSFQFFQTVDGANTIRSTDFFFGLEVTL